MATSLTLENDSSLAQGYLKVNGTTSATLTTSGITGNLTGNVTGNVTGNLTGSLTAGGSLTFATAQTATGTAVDFTGIPSWAKRITVMLSGVSTNGTSLCVIRLGSGSISSTGYQSTGWTANTTNTTITSGLLVSGSNANSYTYTTIATLCLVNSSTNLWAMSGCGAGDFNGAFVSGGDKVLSGVLDSLRITTVNGTDTFDAGTINICYEG